MNQSRKVQAKKQAHTRASSLPGDGHPPNRHPSDVLAEAILGAARAVEQAEHLIKAEILRAAEEGNVERIKGMVGRWMLGPVSAVLEVEPPSATGGRAVAAALVDDSENLENLPPGNPTST